MAPRVALEMVGDLLCPWCYIGLAHVARALDQAGLGGDAVAWRFTPYLVQSAPGITRGEGDLFADLAKSRVNYRFLQSKGAEAGVRFTMPTETSRIYYPAKAHLLAQLAEKKLASEQKLAFKLALYAGVWGGGNLHLDSTEALLPLATSFGLEEQEVRDLLEDADAEAAVVAEAAQAKERQAGVPQFYFRDLDSDELVFEVKDYENESELSEFFATLA